MLGKIFIYNILQQRLDRLLLAVLKRKRGRSVHEWDCRLGWGSAGKVVQGEEAEDQANRRVHQRGRRRRLHLLQDPKVSTGDTVEVKMQFTPFTWFYFWKQRLPYLKWGKSEETKQTKKKFPNDVPFIRPCASEIPPLGAVREQSVDKMPWHAITNCTLPLTCPESGKKQHKIDSKITNCNSFSLWPENMHFLCSHAFTALVLVHCKRTWKQMRKEKVFCHQNSLKAKPELDLA